VFQDVLYRFVPNEGGVLCIGALVAFLVYGHLGRLGSRRNLALLGLLALAPVLTDIMRAPNWRLTLAFEVLFLLLLFYVFWAYRLSRDGSSVEIGPKLGAPALRNLLIALLLLAAVVVFGRPPDDAGRYANLAAARWLETGRLPYGDPSLRGPESPARGAGATYPPLLIAAHLPFQAVLGTERNSPEADPRTKAYKRPSNLVTQMACYAFFLIAILALFQTVRREAGIERGLGAAILLASSPYMLGMGSSGRWLVTGLTYISHIAPSAAVLLALWAAPRAWLSGGLLAASVGLLYWPGFAFPAWLGWYFWRREGAIAFTAGFAAVSAVLVLMVLTMTDPWEDDGVVRTFFDATFGHQEGTTGNQYGASGFGFWNTHPKLAALLHTPLLESVSLSKPTFLVFASLSAAGFWLARGRSLAQLAALTAMVGAAVQLWKTHGGGTYVGWFFPFLLVALLARPASVTDPRKKDPA
jgi:hypothetical protein